MQPELSRRSFFQTVTAAGLLTVTSSKAAPAVSAPQVEPKWKRLAVGDIQALIVSDGELPQGDPAAVFKGYSEVQVRAALRDEFLDDKNMTLDQNAIVLLAGTRAVLFDTGTGGAPIFGDKPGRLVNNLAAAGIDPVGITDVIISHAHPDHLWGLTDESGALNFPNAQVHVPAEDYKFFSDPTVDKHPIVGPFNPATRAELAAVKDRLNLLVDGQEVLPGITAMTAAGHTPGHTIFAIHSGNKSLIVTADLAHSHVLHTRYPDIQLAFDTDPEQMVQSRLRYFDMLATDRLEFLAYHFPFPGAGHLKRATQGYQWIPASIDTI